MTVASLVFALDRSAKAPVFEQIYTAIRAQISRGALPPDARMPATRVLASDLGVARATVVLAYDQLAAEGYLLSRRGSGYRVCAMSEVELPPKPSTSATPPPSEVVLRPLEPGRPDMRLFPHRAWAKCIARLCRNNPESLLTGCGVKGHPELRQAIADHVRDWRGLAVSAEQVIVTSGATEALSVCLRALAPEEGAIGIEDPGYPPIRSFATGTGLTVRDLALDDQGASVPQRGDGTRLVVLTPSHQYPLGGAMSPGRRQAFLKWAEASQGWIVEDDYDSEFRYAGRPIPAMAGSDPHGRTAYIGSFSMLFSHGLRLGYLIAPAALVPRLYETLASRGHSASAMPQLPLARFMQEGEFYRHLRRVRRIYSERHRALIERLLADYAGFAEIKDHQAGMQVVMHLPPHLSDKEIVARMDALGLGVEALSSFCVTHQGYNGLVLGGCLNDLKEQTAALDVLHKVIDSLS